MISLTLLRLSLQMPRGVLSHWQPHQPLGSHLQVAVVDAAGQASKAQTRTAALEQRVRQLQRQVQDREEAEEIVRQQLHDMRVRLPTPLGLRFCRAEVGAACLHAMCGSPARLVT